MACGMVVTKTDGVITEICADPDYPTSHGYLCPKAFSIPELVSSPQRLTMPLKKLPDGSQVEISWDEALDLAAEKLLEIRDKYGPNAIIRCSGSPVNYDARDGFNALFNAMGSGSATGAASQCHVPRNLGHLDVLGERGEPDFEHTDLIVMIGANLMASNRLGGYCAYPHTSALIKNAQKRGCPVIVIDPIHSETAKLADRWIPLRCGTDAALLLALAMVLSLAACGGSDAPAAEAPKADAPAAEAPKADAPAAAPAAYKDELNIAITANPPTLDVHFSNSNIVGGIGSHIYEPLFAMNQENVPTAVLAESYEIDETGTVYTIKIRQGIKFHNGQEMTADDVVPSMEN